MIMKTSICYAIEVVAAVAVFATVKHKSRKVLETVWVVDGTRVLCEAGIDKPGKKARVVGTLTRLGPCSWLIAYRANGENRTASGASPLALAQEAYQAIQAEHGTLLTESEEVACA